MKMAVGSLLWPRGHWGLPFIWGVLQGNVIYPQIPVCRSRFLAGASRGAVRALQHPELAPETVAFPGGMTEIGAGMSFFFWACFFQPGCGFAAA